MLDQVVVMISRDVAIADRTSEVFARHVTYSAHVRKLYVVVLSPFRLFRPLRHGALTVYPWWYIMGLFIVPSYWGVTTISCQDPLYAGLIGYVLTLRARARLHIQVHGDYLGNKYWLGHAIRNTAWQRIARALLRRADKIRVVSARIQRHLVTLGVEATKIVVLPIFHDSGESRGEARDIHKDKIVLFAGRFSWEKNCSWLIRSWARVQADYPEWKLVMIGDGPEHGSLLKQCKDLDIQDRVQWHGWQHDMAPWYERATLFVLPSFFEGWGRVALEAMEKRCAVIMSDVGLAGEVVKNQENGIVVSLEHEESLAQALRALMDDPHYTEALALTGALTAARYARTDDYFKRWEESL